MHLTRRHLAQLGLLVLAAIILSSLLRQSAPLGTDVGRNPLAVSLQRDRSSPSSGEKTANLTLVLFTDYGCSACRVAYPEMKKAVTSDGRIRVVYKDWPIFGPASERAAEVAIASAYQGIYPAVHDRLMMGRYQDEAALRAAVEGAGGDWLRIQADLERRRPEIMLQLARNQVQAFQLGVEGTPAYLAGPILVRGALRRSEFRELFARARQVSKLGRR